MIPELYSKDSTSLIGTLNDSIQCIVSEERNGAFELKLTYPANSQYASSLIKENVIVANANDTLKAQKFRIYNIQKLLKKRIKIYARHISFDLAYDFIDNVEIKNQSCEYALNTLFRNSQFSQNYVGYSDIINAQNFNVSNLNLLKCIAGAEGSIIDTYGTGVEILRDNTNIHVLNSRGYDNEVTIEYKKNLTGFEMEEDIQDLTTRIKGYATYIDEENNEIVVETEWVDSPLINNYSHPYAKRIDFSDRFKDDEIPTVTKIIELINKKYNIEKVDIPKLNYKLEFIPLSKCLGFEDMTDKISLCDKVTVINSVYNINTKVKVIKANYNSLLERYESMELGEPRTTLGDIIGGTGNNQVGPPGPQGPQGPPGQDGQDGQDGADGSVEDFPDTLPSTPVLSSKLYGFANIELSWTFENQVYYSYELYASKTNYFTPNTFNLIFQGQASTFLFQAKPNETWYFRCCAINSYGKRTAFSSQITVTTTKISDLSNYVDNAAIGEALIGTLSLDRGWFGSLRGNYIDAKQLSVTDGNGKRTLDIDSYGNVRLNVTELSINSSNVATQSYTDTVGTNATNNANNATIEKLKKYSTTSEMNSAINVASENIQIGVSKKYSTKEETATAKNEAINSANSNTTKKLESYSTTSEMNSAISIASSNIELGVSQRYSTKQETTTAKQEAINSANATTDNKLKSYSTTTEMKSAINLSAESVKTTVSQTYSTKSETTNAKNEAINSANSNTTEALKPYAKTSEVNQTVDSWVAKFSSSGGQNLIKNGCFWNDTGQWEKWGSPSEYQVTNSSSGYKKSLKITTTGNNQGARQTVSYLVVGRKYTLSAYVHVTSGQCLIQVENNGTYPSAHTSKTGWQWLSLTFTASATSVQVLIGKGSGGAIGGYNFTAVMLQEGDIRTGWTPHSSEIYEGSTMIDANGVEITNGKLKVTNANSQVVIDGQYNIHKIVATGIMDCNMPINIQNRDFYLEHNMGYIPHTTCEQMMNNDGQCVPLHAMSFVSEVTLANGTKGLGFDMVIRSYVTNNRLYINIKRSSSRAARVDNIKVRYFIYKEVAF